MSCHQLPSSWGKKKLYFRGEGKRRCLLEEGVSVQDVDAGAVEYDAIGTVRRVIVTDGKHVGLPEGLEKRFVVDGYVQCGSWQGVSVCPTGLEHTKCWSAHVADGENWLKTY